MSILLARSANVRRMGSQVAVAAEGLDAAMAKRAEKCIEDLAVGESISHLSVGPQDEVWSACGMTWESRSVRLPKRIPLFGFGPNKFYAYRVHVKRVA